MFSSRLTFLSLLCLWMGMGAELVQSEEADVREVFAFHDNKTFVENLHMLRNGKLLLSTMDAPYSGDLLILNPFKTPPEFKSLASLPGCDGLTGIAHLGGNRYAATGGIHLPFMFQEGTMGLHVVEVDEDHETGRVIESIPVPDTNMLNGMDSIPASPHIVLSVDSIGGRMFRINTLTKEVDIAFTHSALGPTDNGVPLGANGLKIKGDYLYFTNSAAGTFARIMIDEEGNKLSCVETLGVLDDVSMNGNLYDDFDIDSEGQAFLSVHHLSVNRIARDGTQTILAGGFSGTLVKDPTSVVVANDGKSVYVGTGGDGSGGQILNIRV
jgi:hypothetical protein